MAYLSPESTVDACAINAELRPRVIAGCTDYFPARKAGNAAKNLFDITHLNAFRLIKQVQGGQRSGGLVTWTEISRTALPAAFLAMTF